MAKPSPAPYGWADAGVIALHQEIAVLKAELMTVYHAARNDVARRGGGQSYGTLTFADASFARRLVRNLQPLLYPEEVANGTEEEATDATRQGGF